MTKKLTKIVKEGDINEEPTIEINKNVTLKSRDYDFSSEESKERIKKVLEKQKMIRKSIYYTKADLEKIYFPQFGPNYGK